MTEVHVIVPEGIDDPARPSGGNTYDRRVCRGLAALGWAVHEHAVPAPGRGRRGGARRARARRPADPGRRRGAARRADRLRRPRGARAAGAPAAAGRARAHAAGPPPAGREAGAVRAREREVLAAAAAVVTTSAWTRRRLGELYALPADRVHVAEPGVDAAGLAPGTAAGDALLCVAAVTPDKGHDVLLDALATATDLSWRCACVGSLDRDPAFADGVRRRARDGGLGDRVRFAGTAHRPGARPRVRRRGPARARLARRDVRHGRHRGPGPRPAGPRRRRRRGDRGPRARGRTAPGRGCWSRPATRRPSAPRCGPGSATPSCAGACAGPPASGARRCAGGRPPTSVLAGVLAGAAR